MSAVGPSTLWPLGVYFACVVGVVAVMVGASFLLGQRHNDRATGEFLYYHHGWAKSGGYSSN